MHVIDRRDNRTRRGTLGHVPICRLNVEGRSEIGARKSKLRAWNTVHIAGVLQSERFEDARVKALSQRTSFNPFDDEPKQNVPSVTVGPLPIGTGRKRRLAVFCCERDEFLHGIPATQGIGIGEITLHDARRSVGSIIGIAEDTSRVVRKLSQSNDITIRKRFCELGQMPR